MRCDLLRTGGEGGGEEGGAGGRVGSSLVDTGGLSSLLLLRSGWVGAASVAGTFGMVWLTGLEWSGASLSLISF